MKKQTLLSLIAVACIASACSSTSSVKLHENTTGGYLAPKGNPHYVTRGGVLYAHDGTRWYALRSAEVDAGDVRGMHVGAPEQWIVAGGSHVITYRRVNYRNQEIRPVFAQN